MGGGPAQRGTIEVGPAQDADAAALLDLHRRVLEEGRWFISYPDELEDNLYARLRLIRDLRADPAGLFLVARRHGAMAGFLTLTPGPLRRMTHAVKLEIMVDPTYRGAGVGRALMAEALAWARANPAVLKVGLTVFADNTRAVRLYEAVGFEVEGRRRGEYREVDGRLRDDLLMGLFVGPGEK